MTGHLSAMKIIGFLSCVKFEKWDLKRKNYVHFYPDKGI